jgi:protein-S-isoprenylcysteine O-methyltransferase Ste14
LLAVADSALSPPPRPSIARKLLNVAMTFTSMSGWRFEHLSAPWVVGGLVALVLGHLVGVRSHITWTAPLYVLAMAFTALAGWRLRNVSAAWIVGGVASLLLGQSLITLNKVNWSIAFYVFSLVFYYGGNALILGSTLPARMIARWGEHRAYRIYEMVLAIMFITQGLGVGCMSALEIGDSLVLPIPEVVAYCLGGSMFAVGLVVKVWSTVLVGADIYYYRDMFLGRPVSKFVEDGPYKVFSNPMYGIGQIHGYGYAIISRSLGGLIAITICHAMIYVFYYSVERPFVQRVYLSSGRAPILADPALPADAA